MAVLEWLLDSDPAIRWQVLRDLIHAPAEVVAAERSRIEAKGWGAALLALQGKDGQWAGGACFPASNLNWRKENRGQPWTSTLPTLQLLHDFGIDPTAERVRHAIDLVKQNCRWEHAGEAFFCGEVEPCINGRMVTLGVYFGQNMETLVHRLLGEQLEDGGWNCEVENGSVRSSFATTINVLEGLLAHEKATGGWPESITARRRGEDTFSSESFSDARPQEQSSTSLGCNSPFLSAGTMTSFVALNTSSPLAMLLTLAWKKQSICFGLSSRRTDHGFWRIRTAARSTSNLRRVAWNPADGIHFERFEFSVGTTSLLRETAHAARMFSVTDRFLTTNAFLAYPLLMLCIRARL
jgi:hypothetical protein